MNRRNINSIAGGKVLHTVLTAVAVLLTSGTATAEGGPTIHGNVYGGGNNADVKINTTVNISTGQVLGNVYGGGNLGDVGTIVKNTTDYNYLWTDDATATPIVYNNTGVCTVNITGSTVTVGPAGDASSDNDHGNVFGGGKGEATTFWCEKGMVYATNVNISAGTVKGIVFGGGEVGRVEDKTTVTIGEDGTSGDGAPYIISDVFGAGKGVVTHGYSALVRGNPVVTIQGTAKIGGSVYGGGDIASVGKHNLVTEANKDDHPELEVGMPFTLDNTNVGICTVTVKDKAEITGNVFGAGKGVNPSGLTNLGRMKPDGEMEYYNEESYGENYKDKLHIYVQTLALTTETHVTIGGSASGTETKVLGSVYGGSESGFVQYHTEVAIAGGQVGTKVYGGGKGLASFEEAGRVGGNTTVTVSGGSVGYDVYGGGERGVVKGSVDVTIKGGTVTHDVYGGGALANTNTAMWDANEEKLLKYAEVTNLTVGSSPVTGYYEKNGDSYEATSDNIAQSDKKYYAVYKTTVNLLGGQLRDAYGGGLGQLENESTTAIKAFVYGDVKVELNHNTSTTDANGEKKGCIVERVFGCNNLNGTPKGKAQVYVYATQNKNTPEGLNQTINAKFEKHDAFETGSTTTYDVKAVYGGGNLSAYEPEDALLDYETNKATVEAARSEVYIYGCDLTSIKQVYGGGNAAPAPATFVQINSVYEIEEVFGGGNGHDNYVLDSKTYLNPGANVGYKNYTHPVWNATEGYYEAVDNTDPDASTKVARQTNYMYGSGIARLEVYGGKIHAAYGGSNEKGNISNIVSSLYDKNEGCTLEVDETYGGGKNSVIDGVIDLDLGCAEDMPQIFGGSRAADVNSDITLKITNGTYGQVFGGNNTSGKVNGSITVIIEESGCKPINIDELYAGGYYAPYSVYGYQADGTPRTLSDYEDLSDDGKAAEGLTNPRKAPRIYVVSASHIGDVFGGGYKATVVGNPHVNINMKKGMVTEKWAKDMAEYEDAEKDDAGNMILPIGTIGNVYGGGNEADIIGNTYVEIGTGKWLVDGSDDEWEDQDDGITRNAATITGNVYGGGKGKADEFTCAKAMVGVVDEGVVKTGEDPNATYTLLDGGTSVTINNGTIKGNVYGGGEVGRVERNTRVTIGDTEETGTPIIQGSVFGAGAGLETHGYSALVRGTSTVTVQGKAQVWKNVYGGGEKASVGRYKVKTPANEKDSDVPSTLPYGMPARLLAGGKSTVTIQGNATIGRDDIDDSGHVFGAGKGVEPQDYTYESEDTKPKRMVSGDTWEYFADKAAYLQFIESLAISGETDVTITGSATVKGSVFGGSESGYVYHNTGVKIQNGTVKGDAFGGGRGLESFAEAGRVRGNTNLTISNGAIEGNVYGGGSLGDVGTIYKPASYDYEWRNILSNGNNLDTDTGHQNTLGNNTITGTNQNTGICKVNISGGTIGLETLSDTDKPEEHGNVFGAGRGSSTTWWCEKAIAYATNVTISDGTVYGTVYGGGEVGRVEDDAKVTIGTSEETGAGKPNITGSVFGGGAGLATHGYSALVRGDAAVTIQGAAKVGGNVYGGGETASVGRFKVVGGLPTKPKGGGTCTVVIKDNAVTGDVYGSCKGVTPNYVASGDDRSKSMQLEANAPTGAAAGTTWDYVETYPEGYTGTKFIWRYYTEEEYLAFLPTLGLASNTHVTIGGSTTVNGSVYGGGQRGLTLGGVDVNITGGTVKEDVYGGGALANSNSSHWHNGERTEYVELDELFKGSSVKGYYTKSGDTYSLIENETGADDKATYYAIFKTNVNLTGGTIEGDAYGGGLGSLGSNPVKAMVYGDVAVTLNGTKMHNTTGKDDKDNVISASGRIFGCNNLNGSPQGSVTVLVEKTVPYTGTTHKLSNDDASGYDVAAVYGGGNMALYEPAASATAQYTHVIVKGCEQTSIYQVYGGGNAASTPATMIDIDGTFEIGDVFGGGNGKDRVHLGDTWSDNPGANVGYYAYPDATRGDSETKQDRIDNFSYGAGTTTVNINGGTIHQVYGGSNTKGNIRESANVMLDEKLDNDGNACCAFNVGEAYGGGKSATMDGAANLEMRCIPGLDEVYGGAENADILNNVTLNITNGEFARVFGGNKEGGRITGAITVNIEETGCRPIIIGELYGGGNRAAYSVWGYKQVTENDNTYWKPRTNASDEGEGPATPYTAITGQVAASPLVDVKSFTSIGTIYGGGYGAAATLVGNPTVRINEVLGDRNNTLYAAPLDSRAQVSAGRLVRNTHLPVPAHDKGTIGSINNVFGGGNEAEVIGTPHVLVGTLDKIDYATKASTETTQRTNVPVVGADIRGNVYGGGNNAPVTGDTEVQIGK